MSRILILVLLVAVPIAALAGIWPQRSSTPSETPRAPMMMEGKTTLTLSASEQMQVTQDRLSAVFTINQEGKDPTTVQEFINQKMRDAVKKAENTSGVKVSTGSYQVYRSYYDTNNNAKAARWQGNQSLTLDSASAEALLTLSGEIQKMGFAASGISYYLSREKAESLRDELIARALDTIRGRANAIGKQLGMSKIHFAQINFDQPAQVMPMAHGAMKSMAMADSAEATPPTAKAGESSVEVTVNVVVVMSE